MTEESKPIRHHLSLSVLGERLEEAYRQRVHRPKALKDEGAEGRLGLIGQLPVLARLGTSALAHTRTRPRSRVRGSTRMQDRDVKERLPSLRDIFR